MRFWPILVLLAPPLADMVPVPAGPFLVGSDDGDLDERPRHRAQTLAFAIDRMEVSRADYAECVAQAACSAPESYPGQTGPDLPRTGVSFRDAQAYCHFRGKRLPTELEWEKAARGTDGRRFPWGDAADCGRANYGVWAGEGPCGTAHPGRPEPVGRYPQGASPYGALDMAGNVWEWVATPYPGTPSAHDSSGAAQRQMLKGGSCCSMFLEPRAANRIGLDPDYKDADIGFRCAKSGP